MKNNDQHMIDLFNHAYLTIPGYETGRNAYEKPTWNWDRHDIVNDHRGDDDDKINPEHIKQITYYDQAVNMVAFIAPQQRYRQTPAYQYVMYATDEDGFGMTPNSVYALSIYGGTHYVCRISSADQYETDAEIMQLFEGKQFTRWLWETYVTGYCDDVVIASDNVTIKKFAMAEQPSSKYYSILGVLSENPNHFNRPAANDFERWTQYRWDNDYVSYGRNTAGDDRQWNEDRENLWFRNRTTLLEYAPRTPDTPLTDELLNSFGAYEQYLWPHENTAYAEDEAGNGFSFDEDVYNRWWIASSRFIEESPDRSWASSDFNAWTQYVSSFQEDRFKNSMDTEEYTTYETPSSTVSGHYYRLFYINDYHNNETITSYINYTPYRQHYVLTRFASNDSGENMISANNSVEDLISHWYRININEIDELNLAEDQLIANHMDGWEQYIEMASSNVYKQSFESDDIYFMQSSETDVRGVSTYFYYINESDGGMITSWVDWDGKYLDPMARVNVVWTNHLEPRIFGNRDELTDQSTVRSKGITEFTLAEIAPLVEMWALTEDGNDADRLSGIYHSSVSGINDAIMNYNGDIGDERIKAIKLSVERNTVNDGTDIRATYADCGFFNLSHIDGKSNMTKMNLSAALDAFENTKTWDIEFGSHLDNPYTPEIGYRKIGRAVNTYSANSFMINGLSGAYYIKNSNSPKILPHDAYYRFLTDKDGNMKFSETSYRKYNNVTELILGTAEVNSEPWQIYHSDSSYEYYNRHDAYTLSNYELWMEDRNANGDFYMHNIGNDESGFSSDIYGRTRETLHQYENYYSMFNTHDYDSLTGLSILPLDRLIGTEDRKKYGYRFIYDYRNLDISNEVKDDISNNFNIQLVPDQWFWTLDDPTIVNDEGQNGYVYVIRREVSGIYDHNDIYCKLGNAYLSGTLDLVDLNNERLSDNQPAYLFGATLGCVKIGNRVPTENEKMYLQILQVNPTFKARG